MVFRVGTNLLLAFVLPHTGAKGKGYGTFHEEAVRVFSSLLEQESIADPIPVIQVRYVVHLKCCIPAF